MRKYYSVYNAKSPKQDSKRFNSIVKTINIADLGIIYRQYAVTSLKTATDVRLLRKIFVDLLQGLCLSVTL